MEATTSNEPEESSLPVEVKDPIVLKKKRKKGRKIERAKGS